MTRTFRNHTVDQYIATRERDTKHQQPHAFKKKLSNKLPLPQKMIRELLRAALSTV